MINTTFSSKSVLAMSIVSKNLYYLFFVLLLLLVLIIIIYKCYITTKLTFLKVHTLIKAIVCMNIRFAIAFSSLLKFQIFKQTYMMVDEICYKKLLVQMKLQTVANCFQRKCIYNGVNSIDEVINMTKKSIDTNINYLLIQ